MKDLFTKNFILMFCANMLLCMSFYMLMPLLPTYAVQELHIDKGNVGIIVGVFSLSAVAMRPLTGVLLDRNNKILIYLPMVILFALSVAGYVIATTFAILLLMRVIHGISWGGVSTSSSAVVADIIPSTMRGLGMGYFGLSMTIAMALGPALAVLLISYISFQWIFFISIMLAVSAGVASFFVKLAPIEHIKSKFTIKSLLESSVFGISFIEFCFGFSYIGILSYATLYGLELGIRYLGLFFFIFAIAVGIFRPLAGEIVDKRGPTLILLIGFGSLFLGLILIALSFNSVMFMIASFLTGLGAGLIMPTLMTMVINTVKPDRRGAGTATLFVALDLGIGTGAMVLGYISHIIGFKGMYLVSAGFLLVPVLWYILHEQYKHQIVRL